MTATEPKLNNPTPTSSPSADPAVADLVITRVFAAPRELVWKAWTEPERFQRWWGPKHFTCPVCQIDLRVGGRFLVAMRSPEGQDAWTTGTYHEIVAPQRLIYSDAFADAEGNVVPATHYGMPGDWPLEMLVTVTFDDVDGQTRLTLRHAGYPMGPMSELAHAGWNESFDKLAESLKSSGSEVK